MIGADGRRHGAGASAWHPPLRRTLRLALDFLARQRAVLDGMVTRRAEALLADIAAAVRGIGHYSVRSSRWMCWVSTCCLGLRVVAL